MNNLIPNPTTKLSIDYPIDKVKKACNFIAASSPNFTLIESNEVFNSFKFGNKDGISLLDLNILDVRLNHDGDNTTSIDIEGSKDMGAIDSATELQMLKSGTDDFLDILSKLVSSENIEETAKTLVSTIKKTKSLYDYMWSFFKWTVKWSVIGFIRLLIVGAIMNALELSF